MAQVGDEAQLQEVLKNNEDVKAVFDAHKEEISEKVEELKRQVPLEFDEH